MSSMKYPYRDLGVTFDRQFRNDLNANFDDIEHDIRQIGGEAAQQALEAADEANTQAIYAQTSGDYANDKGDYAAQQGDYAKTQGDYAKAQGDYAKAQGDYAKQVADENKTRLLTPVATFADIATTYPNPQHGDTVQTLDDGKFYRYENGQWKFKYQLTGTAISNIVSELTKQNQQSVTIGHGLNIINASQNSPLDVKIEGRTLVNVSQNVLDSAKYYVLADKKSKVKFADGTTYPGVTKFQGKAEKPILIRVSNFENKVSGSTVENPHVAKYHYTATSPQSPSNFTIEFQGASSYDRIFRQDGNTAFVSATTNGNIAQHLFSFNLIEAIERNVGKIPASDTAGKVNWLRNNGNRFVFRWYGFGSSVGGNKATIATWYPAGNTWTQNISHTSGTVTGLSITRDFATGDRVDSNGFVHFLAYAEPSDGVTPSTIYTDYVELEIELKPEAQLWNPRFPLYEVDATTEYPNILTTWDENEVMRRYPMVESVQHVQNPYVIAEGDNLHPNFDEYYSLHANATIVNSQTLEFTHSSITSAATYRIKVVPNTPYYLRVIRTNGNIEIRKTDGTLIVGTSNDTSDLSFTPNVNEIEIRYVNRTANVKATFSQPMLTLGNQPKPFVPRNPSMLLVSDVKLGSLADKKDILWKDRQDWKVTKWVEKDIQLTGSLTVAFNADYTGYKRVSISPNNLNIPYAYGNDNDNRFVVTKFNGTILKNGAVWSNGDQSLLDTAANGGLKLTISDTDSGWGDTYMPTAQEIQAYFYGWRMCNGTYGQPYDGTGTKTWYPIGDTDLSRATTTCPTSAAPTIAEGKIGYYKLSYVLSTPVTEVVTDKVEGDLVVNGATQVEVGSGVIVREKVTPYDYTNGYVINSAKPAETISKLKYRLLKFINIYKNGVVDSKWFINPTDIANSYGLQRATIGKTDYDPTAEYTVTYLVLDRHLFTTNILAVTATYDSSLKSVVDSVVAKQSDLASNQQALIRSVAELYKRVKALGG
jgi:hypothetical protein